MRRYHVASTSVCSIFSQFYRASLRQCNFHSGIDLIPSVGRKVFIVQNGLLSGLSTVGVIALW